MDSSYNISCDYGMWHSLVARIVRDDEAAGSNPVIPTSKFSQYRKILAFFYPKQRGELKGSALLFVYNELLLWKNL